MLRAGTVEEIIWNSGEWIFLDIGFSEKSASCGLLFGEARPRNVRFHEAQAAIIRYISEATRPINLVIEAPLSVAFNEEGNPTGRLIEKGPKSQHRYWYVQGGCGVMVASLYLVKSIMDAGPAGEVRLFEGFVSFKPKGEATDHSKDVTLLREVVKNPVLHEKFIYSPTDLKQRDTDRLQSAFALLGLDRGVPAIIKTT